METIFDYNPTERELNRFNLLNAPPEMLKYAKESKCVDDHLYKLGMLFSMRGDSKRANEYWSKIEDHRLLSTLIEDF